MAEKNEYGRYEVAVDGQTYSFEKWGAEEALKTLIKISKIAGKPIGLFLGVLLDKKEDGESLIDKELKSDMLAVAIESLTANLDEDVCVALIKKLTSDKVWCANKPINFNTHYEDKLDHMFKVVAAAVEVQYGNFFVALTALAPKGPKKGPTNRK